MYKRILVPVDGSETANRGLAEALKLAKALGASVKLVHIVDNSALALNPEAGVAAAPLAEDFSEAGKAILEEARAAAEAEGAPVEAVLHDNFTGRVAGMIVQEAKTWGADGIRVNCIAPGLIRTEFARALWEDERTLRAATNDAALHRIGEPDEMAGAVVYLCSPAASFVTGQTLVLDGGRLL